MHVIADCHIYDRHVPLIEKLISREPYAAPEVRLDAHVDNFYSFTKDSFTVENYQYHAFSDRIEVAV